MNIVIPSKIAIALIAAVAIVFAGLIINFSRSVTTINAIPRPSSSVASAKPIDKCQPHAYQGKAEVKVSYVPTPSGWALKISDRDLPSLPVAGKIEDFDGQFKNITLVDADEKIHKKLEKATDKNPQTITITGYATRCGDVALASLNYQDGIFKSYLTENNL